MIGMVFQDASNLVTIKRDAMIKAVMMYLGTDVDKLCRRVDEVIGYVASIS